MSAFDSGDTSMLLGLADELLLEILILLLTSKGLVHIYL
jgi:hypothetical protein